MRSVVRYLAVRISFLLLTFIVAITIMFILPRIIPGNPLAVLLTRIMEQSVSSPQEMAEAEKKLLEVFGWDKPVYVQYLEFLYNVFRGDLGYSVNYYPERVVDLVFRYLPWTLGLLIPATITSWILGNLLGALAAYRRKTAVDNALLTVFLILTETPYYWLAMILLYIFAVNLRIFPVGGAYPAGMKPSLTLEFISGMLYHYILPFLSIVIAAIGGWAIGMRSLMIYELRSDYIVYGDTLGLPDNKLLRYAFKNASLPQVTGLAIRLGSIVGGALITELVFNYPGTGYILFRALTTQDYPLIQGIFVLLISTLLAALFIVELIYAYIDPRIRVGQGE